VIPTMPVTIYMILNICCAVVVPLLFHTWDIQALNHKTEIDSGQGPKAGLCQDNGATSGNFLEQQKNYRLVGKYSKLGKYFM
jgi:hypothetical protein